MLDLDAIERQAIATIDDCRDGWPCPDCFASETQHLVRYEVPALIARVRELEALNAALERRNNRRIDQVDMVIAQSEKFKNRLIEVLEAHGRSNQHFVGYDGGDKLKCLICGVPQ